MRVFTIYISFSIELYQEKKKKKKKINLKSRYTRKDRNTGHFLTNGTPMLQSTEIVKNLLPS